MKHAGILIIGGAIAAYLLFARKGQREGGTGGSLNIPAPSPDALGNYSISGDPYNPGSPSNPSQPSTFTISDKILAAMTNPFLPNSISFTESALNTKKATDASVSTFLGGNMPAATTSRVSLPAWMTGEAFTENVNKLRGEGYGYSGLSPTGEFTFSKKLESAPAPVLPSAPALGLVSVGKQGGANVFIAASRGSTEGMLYYPGGSTTLGIGEVMANMKAKGYTNIYKVNSNTYAGTR